MPKTRATIKKRERKITAVYCREKDHELLYIGVLLMIVSFGIRPKRNGI
jgi:hypothetical protein